jgi:Eukaryotic aspartyl protease
MSLFGVWNDASKMGLGSMAGLGSPNYAPRLAKYPVCVGPGTVEIYFSRANCGAAIWELVVLSNLKMLHSSADTTRDGNDGPWSTFVFQVGTPPQTVKLLPSTASYETWVIAPEGCQAGDPSDCHTMRGELYNYNTSSTWDPNLTNTSTQVYPLELEVQLGYTGKGRYGFDDVTFGYIGSGGLLVKNQSIAGIATKNYFMGLFGLTPRSKNFTSFNNPIPSFMQSLQNQSRIPSLSWSYTAGNQYRMWTSTALFRSSTFI